MSIHKNCILYLVRTSEDDLEMLNKSLRLLDTNLLPALKERTDIILFHESSFGESFRSRVTPVQNGTIVFQNVTFIAPSYSAEIRAQIPEFYPHPTAANHRGFTMGYRHMCDFFSGALYDQPIMQHYEYYLRLDTDSFILSKIRFDLFDWMHTQHVEYAFMESALQQDHPKVIEGLWAETRKWLGTNHVETQVPLETLPEGKMFYTNFEMGKVSSFSKGSAYYRYYEFIKSTGNIYIKRWGDAPIKYLGVNLFLPTASIQPVYGFIYQHGAVFDLFGYKKTFPWNLLPHRLSRWIEKRLG
jgi:alpha 1,2-mannosyltransferase